MQKTKISVINTVAVAISLITFSAAILSCKNSSSDNSSEWFKPAFSLKGNRANLYSGKSFSQTNDKKEDAIFLFELNGCGARFNVSGFWKSTFIDDFAWQASEDSLYIKRYYYGADDQGQETIEAYKVNQTGDSLFLTNLQKKYKLALKDAYDFPAGWNASTSSESGKLKGNTFVSLVQQNFDENSNFSQDAIEALKKVSSVNQMTRIVFTFNSDGSGFRRESMAANLGSGLPMMSVAPMFWHVENDSLIYQISKGKQQYERHSAHLLDASEGLILSEGTPKTFVVSVYKRVSPVDLTGKSHGERD